MENWGLFLKCANKDKQIPELYEMHVFILFCSQEIFIANVASLGIGKVSVVITSASVRFF